MAVSQVTCKTIDLLNDLHCIMLSLEQSHCELSSQTKMLSARTLYRVKHRNKLQEQYPTLGNKEITLLMNRNWEKMKSSEKEKHEQAFEEYNKFGENRRLCNIVIMEDEEEQNNKL
jgi:hypothetical protein